MSHIRLPDPIKKNARPVVPFNTKMIMQQLNLDKLSKRLGEIGGDFAPVITKIDDFKSYLDNYIALEKEIVDRVRSLPAETKDAFNDEVDGFYPAFESFMDEVQSTVNTYTALKRKMDQERGSLTMKEMEAFRTKCNSIVSECMDKEKVLLRLYDTTYQKLMGLPPAEKPTNLPAPTSYMPEATGVPKQITVPEYRVPLPSSSYGASRQQRQEPPAQTPSNETPAPE